MENVESIQMRGKKWYNSYKFPLIPQLQIKKGDEYNTPRYNFHWLLIKIWSLDSFEFEIAFTISDHWGIGIIAIVPYTRMVFAIPFPDKFSYWICHHLFRKPKKPS
jgi:hypothetical protein